VRQLTVTSAQTDVRLLTTYFLAAGAAASASDFVELLRETPADLTRLLDERAARAQRVDEHVHQHATGDALLLAQAPADHRPEVESDKRQQSVQKAVLADTLGVLTHRVARTDVGQQAQFHVKETAKQTELPVRTSCLLYSRHGYEVTDIWIVAA